MLMQLQLHRHPLAFSLGFPASRRTFATYARAVASRIPHPPNTPPPKPRPLRHQRPMDTPLAQEDRVPLSLAVSDCVRRWFKDTLKAALAGDTSMQILVAQMYHSGYGVAKNQIQAKKWIKEASKYRSSAWKDSGKRPVMCSSSPDNN